MGINPTIGIIGQSYAVVEVSGANHLGSLAGWVVLLAQVGSSYGAREVRGQEEAPSQTTGAGQNVLGYEGIYETWKVAWDGDGQANFHGDNFLTWQEFGLQRTPNKR